MEQPVQSNSFEKFKAISSLPSISDYFSVFLCPYFRLKKKQKNKGFFKKSSKPGHGTLVLITSTVQVELWKLNINFDVIRTNSLQVLTYCDFSRSLCYDDARH